MLVAGRVVTRTVFGCIGRSPDDAIDTQQAQPGPSGIAGRFMPAFLSQIEDLSYGLAAQPLTGLDYGAGRDQRTLPKSLEGIGSRYEVVGQFQCSSQTHKKIRCLFRHRILIFCDQRSSNEL